MRFSINVFSILGSNKGFHISFSCHASCGPSQFSSLFLFFIRLTVLRCICQIFCRKSRNLSLTTSFSWFDRKFWEKLTSRRCTLLITSYLGLDITFDVNFKTYLKQCLSHSPLSFPFCILCFRSEPFNSAYTGRVWGKGLSFTSRRYLHILSGILL